MCIDGKGEKKKNKEQNMDKNIVYHWISRHICGGLFPLMRQKK